MSEDIGKVEDLKATEAPVIEKPTIESKLDEQSKVSYGSLLVYAILCKSVFL